MKKKKKTSAGRTGRRRRANGFDYAGLPRVAAISSPEFPSHLHSARVDGVAYGVVWSTVLNENIPCISLVAQDGDALTKAFEELNAWSRLTDPDSVELTFVFLRDGGYVLGITPEHSRLTRRCLGFRRAHQVLVLTAMWFKRMDSIHPALHEFREYSSRSVAPFSFGGCTYVGPRSALTPTSPPDTVPISSAPLLKFEVTFVEEDDAEPNSIGWVAIHAQSEQNTRPQTRPPKLEREEQARTRRRALACHFPVTLERLYRRGDVSALMRHFAATDVRPWQIEQALCNLVLSHETGNGPHFENIDARNVIDHVTQAMECRLEIADGGTIPQFTVNQVQAQIIADGNALLRYLKKKRRPNLSAVLGALASASLLDAEAVAVLAWNEGRRGDTDDH